MSGSLSEVRPGFWKVRVYVGTVDGVERVKNKTFEAKNAKEARRLMHGHVAQILAETEATVAKAGLVNGLVDDWWKIGTSTWSPTTAARYKPIVERIRQRLGPISLDQLNGQHVAEFYAWLRTTSFRGHGHTKARKLSEATVHHHYRVLHAILATGETWDRVAKNAARKTTKPKAPKTRIVSPSSADVSRLITAAGTSWGTVFAFAAKTGMRCGEVCAIRWADLHDGIASVHGSVYQLGGKVVDKTTKTDEPREVELDGDTQLLLSVWRATLEREAANLGATLSPKARLFPNLADDPRGTAATKPGTMSQYWRRLCDREGVACKLHALRHWNATQLLYDGISLADVAAHHGHAQVATTANFYAHARPSDGRIAASMAAALPLSARDT